jgi:hypothetical protein
MLCGRIGFDSFPWTFLIFAFGVLLSKLVMFYTFTRILAIQKLSLVSSTRSCNLSKQRLSSFLQHQPLSPTNFVKDMLFTLKPSFQAQFPTLWRNFVFSQRRKMCSFLHTNSNLFLNWFIPFLIWLLR